MNVLLNVPVLLVVLQELLRWVLVTIHLILCSVASVLSTISGWWSINNWEWWDLYFQDSSALLMVLLTSQACSFIFSVQWWYSQDSVLLEHVMYCFSMHRTTLNSGTPVTTWCSHQTSFTIVFQPITLKLIIFSQLKWWRSIKAHADKYWLNVKPIPMKWRELCTQVIPTTFTSHSEAKMMTGSNAWRMTNYFEIAHKDLNFKIVSQDAI